MAVRTGILAEVDELERSVSEYEESVAEWRHRLGQGKRPLRRSRLRFVAAILLALLLTSSCSLHAMELLGGPSAEEIGTRWASLLDGLIAKAAEHGKAPGTAAEIALTVLNAPIRVCSFMPVSVLRMACVSLQRIIPKASSKAMAFIELAIVVFVLAKTARRELSRYSRRHGIETIREARAELQKLQANSAQMSEVRAKAASLKKSEAYQKAEAEYQETRKREEAVRAEVQREVEAERQKRIAQYRKRLEAAVPAYVSPSHLECFLEKDAEKALLTAEVIAVQIADHSFDKLLAELRDRMEDSEIYLRYFEHSFDRFDIDELRNILFNFEREKKPQLFSRRGE